MIFRAPADSPEHADSGVFHTRRCSRGGLRQVHRRRDGLALPSTWLTTAPFPVLRLNGSYPTPAIVASPLSTLATYVKSVGGAQNVSMAYN